MRNPRFCFYSIIDWKTYWFFPQILDLNIYKSPKATQIVTVTLEATTDCYRSEPPSHFIATDTVKPRYNERLPINVNKSVIKAAIKK